MKQKPYVPQFDIENIEETPIPTKTCKHCGKSGKHVGLDSNGLCVDCRNSLIELSPADVPDKKLFQKYMKYNKIAIYILFYSLMSVCLIFQRLSVLSTDNKHDFWFFLNISVFLLLLSLIMMIIRKITVKRMDQTFQYYNNLEIAFIDNKWVCPCCNHTMDRTKHCERCGVLPKFKAIELQTPIYVDNILKKPSKKSSAKTQKIISVIFISCLCSCLFYGCFCYCSNIYEKQSKYSHAKELLKTGHYKTAITEFEKIKDFKDSEALYTEAIYNYGIALYTTSAYSDSIDYFSQVKNYKDSAKYLQKAKDSAGSDFEYKYVTTYASPSKSKNSGLKFEPLKKFDAQEVIQKSKPNVSKESSSENTKSKTRTKNEDKTTIVYITNTGSKYHKAYCQYISDSKSQISLSEAIKQGYAPCSVCYP